MRVAALLMTVLTLAGCGAGGALLPAARPDGGGLAAQSLSGDLARRFGPVAARKAVQLAVSRTLRNDAEAVAEWQDSVSQKNDPEQVAFLERRLKSLQRVVTAADVALLPLAAREDVFPVRKALEAAKAEDRRLAKLYAEKAEDRPDAEKAERLYDWSDALSRRLAEVEAAF